MNILGIFRVIFRQEFWGLSRKVSRVNQNQKSIPFRESLKQFKKESELKLNTVRDALIEPRGTPITEWVEGPKIKTLAKIATKCNFATKILGGSD